MNDVEHKLKSLGEGNHHCGFLGGWVSIQEVCGGYDVFWTSNKEFHNILSLRKAVFAEFINGDFGLVFSSYFLLYPADMNYNKTPIENFIKKKIDQAFQGRIK